METQTLLSEAILAEINHWLTKYPPEQKQSALIPALLTVQEHHQGWLTNELIEAVADYLELPRIAAYEVATFYSMLELSPVGKFKISVCTNISCMLSGSGKIVDHLKQRLGVNLGETTADGLFTLREVECLAACANAPVCQIGKKYYEDLTPDKIDTILQELKGSAHG